MNFIFIMMVTAYTTKASVLSFLDYFEEEMDDEDPQINYLMVQRPDGSIDIEDLTHINVTPTATQKDVTIYFYSRPHMNESVSFNVALVEALRTTIFDPSKETVFIIHGWQNNASSPVNALIKEAILKNYDVNVFVVDWSPLAMKSYVTAYVNLDKVGRVVGYFIGNISVTYNCSLSNIRIVGHSLGAHVAGIAGNVTGGELKSIVGLDPAGPLFRIASTENRLSKDDAQYVEVIHTCGKLLGFFPPLGDSDFYPNGGLSQPGCNLVNDFAGTCSHGKSYEYYAESVSSSGFVSTACSYYLPYLLGACDDNGKVEMGEFHPNTTSRGKYYLRTNSKRPYAQGQ